MHLLAPPVSPSCATENGDGVAQQQPRRTGEGGGEHGLAGYAAAITTAIRPASTPSRWRRFGRVVATPEVAAVSAAAVISAVVVVADPATADAGPGGDEQRVGGQEEKEEEKEGGEDGRLDRDVDEEVVRGVVGGATAPAAGAAAAATGSGEGVESSTPSTETPATVADGASPARPPGGAARRRTWTRGLGMPDGVPSSPAPSRLLRRHLAMHPPAAQKEEEVVAVAALPEDAPAGLDAAFAAMEEKKRRVVEAARVKEAQSGVDGGEEASGGDSKDGGASLLLSLPSSSCSSCSPAGAAAAAADGGGGGSTGFSDAAPTNNSTSSSSSCDDPATPTPTPASSRRLTPPEKAALVEEGKRALLAARKEKRRRENLVAAVTSARAGDEGGVKILASPMVVVAPGGGGGGGKHSSSRSASGRSPHRSSYARSTPPLLVEDVGDADFPAVVAETTSSRQKAAADCVGDAAAASRVGRGGAAGGRKKTLKKVLVAPHSVGRPRRLGLAGRRRQRQQQEQEEEQQQHQQQHSKLGEAKAFLLQLVATTPSPTDGGGLPTPECTPPGLSNNNVGVNGTGAGVTRRGASAQMRVHQVQHHGDHYNIEGGADCGVSPDGGILFPSFRGSRGGFRPTAAAAERTHERSPIASSPDRTEADSGGAGRGAAMKRQVVTVASSSLSPSARADGGEGKYAMKPSAAGVPLMRQGRFRRSVSMPEAATGAATAGGAGFGGRTAMPSSSAAPSAIGVGGSSNNSGGGGGSGGRSHLGGIAAGISAPFAAVGDALAARRRTRGWRKVVSGVEAGSLYQ